MMSGYTIGNKTIYNEIKSLKAGELVIFYNNDYEYLHYLHTNRFRLLNENAIELVNKIFITVDIDNENWEKNLTNILNKPYEQLIKMWKSKEIDRNQHDDEWLLGMKWHAGKLGARYIDRFMKEDKK